MQAISVQGTRAGIAAQQTPFPVFTDAELRELRQVLPEADPYQAGQPICRYGEPGDRLFIVLEGSVQMDYTPPGGKNEKLHAVGKGGFFGEVATLLGGHRTATVIATDLTRLLVLKREDLDKFLDMHPRLARRIMEGMAWRLRNSGDLMHRNPLRDMSRQADVKYTQDDRAVLGLAKFLGKGGFLVLFGLLFALYIVLNGRKQFDPSYVGIGLVLSVLQIVIGNVIVNSQNRVTEREQPLARKEREANLDAAKDIIGLQSEMRDQYAEVLRRLEELKKPTPPAS